MASKAKTAKKIKVAIYVLGGCVQIAKANQDGVDVTVFDVDNLKEEGVSSKEIDERWDKILDVCHWDA